MSIECECPGLSFSIGSEGYSFTVLLTKEEVCNASSVKDIAKTFIMKVRERYYSWIMKVEEGKRKDKCQTHCKEFLKDDVWKYGTRCIELCTNYDFNRFCEEYCRKYTGLMFFECGYRCSEYFLENIFIKLFRVDEPRTYDFIYDHPHVIKAREPDAIYLSEELLRTGRFAGNLYPYVIKWIVEAVLYTRDEEIENLIEKCKRSPPSRDKPIVEIA